MPGFRSALFVFMKTLTVLGSTGSIGSQTLEVAKLHGYKIKGLSANNNVRLIEEQAREFCPEFVCLNDEKAFKDIKIRLADTGIKVLSGKEGLCQLAAEKCDMLINSVVGMIGLEPTLAAIKAGNRIGLANKETMVVGGELVTALAKDNNVEIIPIDSEHSAIFQSIMGNSSNKIERIMLTASGGPFFGYNIEQLRSVTKAEALKHPNWSMGKKITTDSATLMNKGLELIEAVHFFDVAPEKIEIVVHRQSILHSAVEFEDGAVIGQFGVPDMKIPIQFAITYPKRMKSLSGRLSLTDIGTLTFEKADEETFICLGLAREAIKKGGTAPCILNSANEAAVAAFLADKIPFFRISELVGEAMEKVTSEKTVNLTSILSAEREAFEFVNSKI